MPAAESPQDVHLDLSFERLAIVAQVIRDARARAFKILEEQPNVAWSKGCLAYEFTMEAFEELSRTTPWLTFMREQSLAYLLKIGSVPIRVQRSDHSPKAVMEGERLSLNKLARQERLSFGDDGLSIADCRIRLEFAVEGPRVGACELRIWDRADNVLYHSWEIGAVVESPISVVSMPRQEAEELPPADFKLEDDDEDRDENAG